MLLKIGKREFQVADFADASARYAAERDESGKGYRTFPEGSITVDGRRVARVSYNARVWNPGPSTSESPLFDPCGKA